MKAVVGILTCLLAGQLLYSASAQPEVAFVEQDVIISEDGPGDTETFFVKLVDDDNSGSGLAAELIVSLEFVTFAGMPPATIPGDFTVLPLIPTQVTFAVGAMIDDTMPIIITGVLDGNVEGNEFIVASFVSNPTVYVVNGAANGDTEFLDIQITDNDAGPVFDFQNADFPIDEDEDAQVCVVINAFEPQTPAELTIEFTIMPGPKADAGSDFVDPGAVTLTFPAGSMDDNSQCATIDIMDDFDVEGEHSFTVSLQNPSSNGVIGTQATATVTITDNDMATLSLGDPDQENEGVDLMTTVQLTLSGGGILECDITVTLDTNDVTASAPSDYIDLTGPARVFTFAAGGMQSMDVTVSTNTDGVVEGPETLTLDINGFTGLAVLGSPNSVTLTILDLDEAIVAIIPGPSSTVMGNEAPASVGVFAICIQLQNNAVNVALTVSLTFSGKATLADIQSGVGLDPVVITLAGNVSPTPDCALFGAVDDNFLEGDHSLTWGISSISPVVPGVSIDPTTHEFTLNDDEDDLPGNTATVQIQDPSSLTVTEAPNAMIEVCVELVNLAAGVTLGCDITATVAVSDGPIANAGSDFVMPEAADLIVTFTEGSENDASDCFQIEILDDDDFEGDHEFGISVMSVSPGIATPFAGLAQITIMDNDDATVALSSSSYGGSEGSVVEVCVIASLTSATGTFEIELTVSLSANNGKADGDDFTLPQDFDVTFPVNSLSGSSQCASITFDEDTFIEGDHSFTVSISDPGGAGTTAPTVATVTINDNDDGEVTITTGDPLVVVEGATGMVCLQLLATGSSTQLGCDVTVTLSATNGKATAGDDFTVDAPFTVTFPPSATLPTMTQCADVTTLPDTLLEGDHSFTVAISTITNDDVDAGTASSIVVTIDDEEDDVNVADLQFADPSLTVVEAPGAMVEVCVVLNNLAAGVTLGCEVTATVAVSDGPIANAGSDFVMPEAADLIVTFPEGSGNGASDCFQIEIMDDDDFECDHDFAISVIGATISPAIVMDAANVGQILITENDDATVTIDATVNPSEADGSVDVCVNPGITGEVQADLTVTLVANDGKAIVGDDYTIPGLEVTFTADESNDPRCVTFGIMIDTVLEGDHDFTVTITDVVSCAMIGTPFISTVTISDDEMGDVMFDSAGSSVVEGADTSGVCLELVSGTASALGCELTVTLTTMTGKADEDDFTHQIYTQVFTVGTTFPDTQCIDISTDDDDLLEGDHDFTVSIVSTTLNDAVTISAPLTHVVTIDDDDGTATITLQSVPPFVSEDDMDVTIEVCVEINDLPTGGLGCDLEVVLSLNEDTAVMGNDFALLSASTTVTFLTGSTNGDSQCIDISIIADDTYEENQVFSVTIDSVSLTTAAMIGAPNSVTITIQDNNDAVVVVQMEAMDVNEESGYASICVESGVTDGFETALTVSLMANDGKANITEDISLPDPFEVVFTVGETDSVGCVDVPITSDTELEGDHDFTVTITSAGNTPHASIGTPFVSTITIKDDESGLVTLAAIVPVDEGDMFMVCVDLICSGSTLGCPLEVELSAISSDKAVEGDDFDAGPYTVSFSVGSALPTQSCITIATRDDDDVERDHDFLLNITSISLLTSVTKFPPTQQTATILDNDNFTVGFNPDTYQFPGGSGDENLTLQITELVGTLECDFEVTVIFTDGPKAKRGVDYQAVDPLVAIFTQGSVQGDTMDVIVTILNDEVVEGDHQFTAAVEPLSPVIAGPEATIVIMDNDNVTVKMAEREYTVGEGDGSVEVCVEASGVPAGGLECDLTISLALTDGTKTVEGEDYSGATAEVTFPESSKQGDTACVDIPITDDDALECSQDFTVSITGGSLPTYIKASHSQATVYIVDNDGADLDFSEAEYRIDESDGTVEVCMDLTNIPAEGLECDLVVPLTLVDGKAKSGSDYSPAPSLNITFTTGTISSPATECASIEIMEDMVIECDHSFTVEVAAGDIDCDVVPPILLGNLATTVTIEDNDVINIAMRDAMITVNEGIGQGEQSVCISVELPAGGMVECELTATVTTLADTANVIPLKEDYVEGPRPITITVNATTGNQFCIDISSFILDDVILESTESFNISLVDVLPCGNVDSSVTVVEILDNDKLQAGFLNSEYSLDEGGNVTVCVELEGYIERLIDDIVVYVKPITGSESDFIIDPSILVFGSGASPINCIHDEMQCLTFYAVDDEIKEDEEKFKLYLNTTDAGVCFCSDQTHVTIEEDDSDVVTVSLSVRNDGNVPESNAAMLVLVTLEGYLEVDVTVTVSTNDGSAVDGEDYRAVTHEIIFNNATDREQRVYVPLFNDDCVEYDEYFSVDLTTSMDCVELDVNIVNITIVDDDVAKFSLKSEFIEVAEDVGYVNVCVILKSCIKRDVLIHVNFYNDSAFEFSDFDIKSSPYLLFDADSEPKDYLCVTFNITDDDCVEFDEEFSVNLTSSDDDVKFHIYKGSVRILDNDDVKIGVQLTEYAVAENGGNISLCVQIFEGCLERDVVIQYATFDATAQNESDYGSTSGELTFEASFGDLSGVGDSECVDIVIVNNYIKEYDESFVFAICSGGDDDVEICEREANVLIDDEDTVTVSLSVRNDGNVPESNAAMLVLVTLEGYLETDITVTVQTSDGTAVDGEDYRAVTHEIIFNNATDREQRVYVPLFNDDCVEYDEYFSVDLTTSMDCVELDVYSVNITIVDDDIAKFTLKSEFIEVAEDVGYVNVCVILKSCIKRDVLIHVNFYNDSAFEFSDFDIKSSPYLLFDADSEPKDYLCVTFNITDDDCVEFDEEFSVNLTSSDDDVRFHIYKGSVRILDNDDVKIDVQLTEYAVAENDGNISLCVQIFEGCLERDVVIEYATFDATAQNESDYGSTSGELTFEASFGDLSGVGDSECVDIVIVNNYIKEYNESFVFAICSGGDDDVEICEREANVLIDDEDTVTVSLSVRNDGNVPESNAAMLVLVTLEGYLETDVTVTVQTRDGTALDGEDYRAVTHEIIFNNATDREQRVYVPLFNDACVEYDEYFSVDLTTSMDCVELDVYSVNITIVDDDIAKFTLKSEFIEVAEDVGYVNVCVILKSYIKRDVLIHVNFYNDSAFEFSDFDIKSSVYLLFDADSEPKDYLCVTFNITDDDCVEFDEEFSVNLTSSDDDVRFHIYKGSVRILDNDDVKIGVQLTEYAVAENGGNISLCVQIFEGCLERDVVIEYATFDATAQNESDYGSISCELTFEASFGDLSGVGDSECVDVVIVNNDIKEYDESFVFAICSGGDDDVEICEREANVLIDDEDTVTVSLSVRNDGNVPESNAAMLVLVTLEGYLETDVTVTVQTSDGTAVDGEDYRAVTHEIIFNNATDREQRVYVPLFNDDCVEYDEYFSVDLTTSKDCIELDVNSVNITIVDDDRPQFSLESDQFEVTESNVNLSICVELKITLKRDVGIYLAVHNGSAKANTDFVGVSYLHILFPAGTIVGFRRYFFIEILDDSIVEQTEYFNVSLFDSVNDSEFHIDEASVRILDDDDSVCVNFTQTEYVAYERNGFVEICVELEGELDDYVSVYLFTVPGTAQAPSDFEALADRLVFHNAGVLCSNITIVRLDIIEDPESFTVVLTTRDDRVQVKQYYVPVTIIDGTEVIIGFNQSVYSAPEEDDSGSGSEVDVCICVTGELERAVVVSFTTKNGTAIGDVDYEQTLLLLTTVEFTFDRKKRSNSGVQTDQQCITLSFLSDELVEDDEEFSVHLRTDDPLVRLSPAYATVIIGNNDRAVVTLLDATITVDESGGIANQCCLGLRSGDLAIDVTVLLTTGAAGDTADPGVDYVQQIDTPLVFSTGSPPGTTVCASLSILPDDILEADEQFGFSLRSNSPVDFFGGSSSGRITIVDDDNVTIDWQLFEYTTMEGDGILTACAEITSGSLERDVVVVCETADAQVAQQATAGEDYTSNSLDKTFDASTNTLCFGVAIEDDDLAESIEFFDLLLGSSDPDVIITRPICPVAIINNDIELAFEESVYNACEREGSITVCVIVEGDRPSSAIFTVETVEGSALEGSDYTGVSEDIVFNPGDPTPCITIPIMSDDEIEECESFFVTMTSTDPNIWLTRSSAIVNVNEAPASIEYINDTPDITGNILRAQFEVKGCVSQIICMLGTFEINCSNQMIDITITRPGVQSLRVNATGPCGSVLLLRRIRTDNPVCHLHQINGGLEEATVVGNTSTAMFEGTGPSAANVVSDYIIRFQQQQANGRFITIRRLLCSQAANVNNGIICAVESVTGHGEVTVSNIVDAGTYGIHLQPQQPTTGIQCTDLRPRRFNFDIPAP